MSDTTEQLSEIHDEAFRWSLACCRYDESMAEDVLQIAYMKVLDGSATFEGRSGLKTFIFGVIRLTAKELARRRRVRDFLLFKWGQEPLPTLRPDEELETKRRAIEIRLALKQLSERQREIAELVFYQDLTIEEAADVMGIGVGSARTHYSRAKDTLKKVLKDAR